MHAIVLVVVMGMAVGMVVITFGRNMVVFRKQITTADIEVVELREKDPLTDEDRGAMD